MIRLEGVTKRYGAMPVVDDLTLTLGEPGLTSLVGPNGAGKSSVLSMIARLLTPDAGRITVDDHDVRTTPGPVLARLLATLRQENSLVARVTVRELASFGRFPHSRGRLTAADRARVEESLEYLDLVPLAGRFLDELSGGQRQRAFIAMVLAQDTKYVLLDEPLNNLDLRHSVEMMRLLRRAADELDRRVVVVLHDLNFASAHSDRIVALKDGRVLAAGTPEEVVTPGVLREVYDLDVPVELVGGMRMGLYYR
ncbi:ABC transporter ATP-binding protein [Naasia sp. SYSU D00057]|uniref:iron ABC transporter ATP-binding protein n=1 Tax=Naasia sp. SYSU D00057 TaxID=2817380 RepID=UPI001B305A13|nr:ATP-binding cassette domain-containing protein [Naasia sp. SYSU D00057]